MPAKITSRLPGDQSVNGLNALAETMVNDPEAMHAAVIYFDTTKITTDVETGDIIPTARIRRIEPITRDDDRAQIDRAVERAHEARTGRAVLPLELEDDLRTAFDTEFDQ